MAQFTIKWPTGAEVSFEGDVSFADLQKFLNSEAPPSLVSPTRGGSRIDNIESSSDAAEAPVVSLAPARVEAQFEAVGARTDVERVTVMAWVAREAGGPGLDAEAAAHVYRELGLPTPGNWRSTFSNAATRGYILNEGRGIWRPTAVGENFARLGQRKASAAKRKRRTGSDAESG